jgi:hypothetical protein
LNPAVVGRHAELQIISISALWVNRRHQWHDFMLWEGLPIEAPLARLSSYPVETIESPNDSEYGLCDRDGVSCPWWYIILRDSPSRQSVFTE